MGNNEKHKIIILGYDREMDLYYPLKEDVKSVIERGETVYYSCNGLRIPLRTLDDYKIVEKNE